MLIPGKSSELLAEETDYRTSTLILSKLKMETGCRRAISKTKTGKMNIIKNKSSSTGRGKGEASDQNHT